MVKTAYFREELDIPEDVKVTVDEDHHITVKGPEGDPIEKDFSHIRGITIKQEENKLIFEAHFPRGSTLALANTIINIVDNLIKGVQNNYKYISMVCYSHFPCSVEAKPRDREIHVINFLGERAPRVIKYDPSMVKVKVEGDEVFLIGADKEVLGQTAADLKKICRIRKKDPRIFQDGVYLYKIMHGEEVAWEIK
ncbi:MAG: 50S ribosomal protein L6 [Candidatus Lokiarchaeota archaeon]|nr:50S ribosomal protein L6 [Candidatus Lokiarchaeota archaeon]MBD3200766.1 50S ribosomal protein L6 [Candidatus Lokiarchaeota archaeon]